MFHTLAEVEELSQMQENVRRCVELLELCWSCQRISECQQAYVDDGSAAWLCCECWAQKRSRLLAEPGTRFWPSL